MPPPRFGFPPEEPPPPPLFVVPGYPGFPAAPPLPPTELPPKPTVYGVLCAPAPPPPA